MRLSRLLRRRLVILHLCRLLDEALTQYEGAIDAINGLPEKEKEDNERLNVRLLHYMVTCQCVESRRRIKDALPPRRSDQEDNQNVKAFYRRGIAKAKLNSLDAAKNDLSAALRIDPANSAAKKE